MAKNDQLPDFVSPSSIPQATSAQPALPSFISPTPVVDVQSAVSSDLPSFISPKPVASRGMAPEQYRESIIKQAEADPRYGQMTNQQDFVNQRLAERGLPQKLREPKTPGILTDIEQGVETSRMAEAWMTGDIEGALASRQRMKEIPVSSGMQKFMDPEKTTMESIKAVTTQSETPISDTYEVLRGAIVPSLVSQVQTGIKTVPATMAAGAGIGAGVGLAGGPVGVGAGAAAGAAYGLPAGIGITSGILEYASESMEELENLGVDTTSPDAVREALANPEIMSQIRKIAASKAIPVAALDALTGGLAGRIPGKSAALKWTGEVAMQAAGGSAGEYTGQVAQNVARGQSLGQAATNVRGQDIFLEAVAEPVTGVGEAIVNRAIDQIRGTPAEVGGVESPEQPQPAAPVQPAPVAPSSEREAFVEQTVPTVQRAGGKATITVATPTGTITSVVDDNPEQVREQIGKIYDSGQRQRQIEQARQAPVAQTLERVIPRLATAIGRTPEEISGRIRVVETPAPEIASLVEYGNKIGVEIVPIESDDDTISTQFNGVYDTAVPGRILVNAKRPGEALLGTALHETVHSLARDNPQDFQALSSILDPEEVGTAQEGAEAQYGARGIPVSPEEGAARVVERLAQGLQVRDGRLEARLEQAEAQSPGLIARLVQSVNRWVRSAAKSLGWSTKSTSDGNPPPMRDVMRLRSVLLDVERRVADARAASAIQVQQQRLTVPSNPFLPDAVSSAPLSQQLDAAFAESDAREGAPSQVDMETGEVIETPTPAVPVQFAVGQRVTDGKRTGVIVQDRKTGKLVVRRASGERTQLSDRWSVVAPATTEESSAVRPAAIAEDDLDEIFMPPGGHEMASKKIAKAAKVKPLVWGGRLSRTALEERLLDVADKMDVLTMVNPDRLQLSGQDDGSYDYDLRKDFGSEESARDALRDFDTSFPGPIPRGLVDALSGKQHLYRLIRRGYGDKALMNDTLMTLGADRYVAALESMFYSGLKSKLKALREVIDPEQDPESFFYMELYDAMNDQGRDAMDRPFRSPKNRREMAQKVESINPSTLPVGTTFSVGGIQGQIVDGDYGPMIRFDRDLLPMTPANALRELPVYEGTVNENPVVKLFDDAGNEVDDVPFSLEDRDILRTAQNRQFKGKMNAEQAVVWLRENGRDISLEEYRRLYAERYSPEKRKQIKQTARDAETARRQRETQRMAKQEATRFPGMNVEQISQWVDDALRVADETLIGLGATFKNESPVSNSRYYDYQGTEIRVSDHSLPRTAERDYAADRSSRIDIVFNRYMPLQDVGDYVRGQVQGDIRFSLEDRPLLAPNGKPSNLTPEQYRQVRTPEFKRWFGDWENDPANASKVVDENGEPMVVYHGSSRYGFNVFDITGRGDSAGSGTFLIKDRELAETYAEGRNAGVYEVFINIKNPFYLNFDGNIWSDASYAVSQKYELQDSGVENTDDIARWVRNKKKNDGVYFYNIMDDAGGNEIPTEVFVVFSPNQIKSAIGNAGAFDPANPDIRFSLRDRRTPSALPPREGLELTRQVEEASRPVKIAQTTQDRLSDMVTSALRADQWLGKIALPYKYAKQSPLFRRFWDTGQAAQNAVSRIVSKVQAASPLLLPGPTIVDQWREATQGLSSADASKLGEILLTGTNVDEKVYTDAELASKFDIDLNTDNGKKIQAAYRQAINAARTSLGVLQKSFLHTLMYHATAPIQKAAGVDFTSNLFTEQVMSPQVSVYDMATQVADGVQNNFIVPEMNTVRDRLNTMIDLVLNETGALLPELQNKRTREGEITNMIVGGANHRHFKELQRNLQRSLRRAERTADNAQPGSPEYQEYMNEAATLDEILADFQTLRKKTQKVSRKIAPAIKVRDNALEINADYDRLSKEGYWPDMRFGEYGLDATVVGEDDTGKPVTQRLFFGMFESPSQRDRAAAWLRENHPDADVKTFLVPKETYKLFQGINPESLAMFSKYLEEGLDADIDQLRQLLIKVGVSDRSASKRLLNRMKIPGYSMDPRRTLAELATSNARLTSRNLYGSRMNDQIKDMEGKVSGDLVNYAVRLKEYMTNWQPEMQKLRSFISYWTILGSLTSGALNLGSVPLQLWPYGTQFLSETQFGAALARASKTVLGRGDRKTRVADMVGNMKIAGLSASQIEEQKKLALARYEQIEEEGLIDPQEIYNVIGMAEGESTLKPSITSGSKIIAGTQITKALIDRAMVRTFAAPESANRHIAFTVGYQIGLTVGAKQGRRGKDLADFAYKFGKETVYETNSAYNRGNRPELFRGPVGAVAGTFKQYIIQYLEFLGRLGSASPTDPTALVKAPTWNDVFAGKAKWPALKKKMGGLANKPVGIALGTVLMLAGFEELPFYGTITDIMDAVLQFFGYEGNTKKFMREVANDILGETVGRLARRGILEGGLNLAVAERIGFADPIPGVSFLKQTSGTPAARTGGALLEIAGPAGGIATNLVRGLDAAGRGRYYDFVRFASPAALKNPLTGYAYWRDGMAYDGQGRPVVRVDAGDAFFRFVGLQPSVVAEAQREVTEGIPDVTRVKYQRDVIMDDMVRAFRANDREAFADAVARLEQWNADYPELAVVMRESDVARSLRESGRTLSERFERVKPKSMREGFVGVPTPVEGITRQFDIVSDASVEERALQSAIKDLSDKQSLGQTLTRREIARLRIMQRAQRKVAEIRARQTDGRINRETANRQAQAISKSVARLTKE